MADEGEEAALARAQRIFSALESRRGCAGGLGGGEPVLPIDSARVSSRAKRTPEQLALWRASGLSLIREGKLGVILLAGGQGTRLGSDAPKGCYDIGLPSRSSLYQLQADRLRALQVMAAASSVERRRQVEAGGEGSQQSLPQIPFYIMTSPLNDAETRGFFREHSWFGLKQEQVMFFMQGMLPCLTLDGKPIIAESSGALSFAPDGNGGIYGALERSGCLADMASRGIKCLDCYCVDNALVRVADPVWVGYCWESGAECGAKVAAKRDAEERVGVFVKRSPHDATAVLEYSEMKSEDCFKRDEEGELTYRWANLCMQWYRFSFLERAADFLEREGAYHLARKSVPSVGGPVDAVKLEAFIFDVFPFANKVALFEIKREEEFAPVKNAPGSPSDSPEVARNAVLDMHRSWLNSWGIELPHHLLVEISPLVSYSGDPPPPSSLLPLTSKPLPNSPYYLDLTTPTAS